MIPLPSLRRPIFAPIRFISRSLRGRAGIATTSGKTRRGRLWDRWRRTRCAGAALGIIRRGKRLWSGFNGHQVAHGVQARFRDARNVRNRALQRWQAIHQKIANATLIRRDQIRERWKANLQSRCGPVPIAVKIFVLGYIAMSRVSPRPPRSIGSPKTHRRRFILVVLTNIVGPWYGHVGNLATAGTEPYFRFLG